MKTISVAQVDMKQSYKTDMSTEHAYMQNCTLEQNAGQEKSH